LVVAPPANCRWSDAGDDVRRWRGQAHVAGALRGDLAQAPVTRMTRSTTSLAVWLEMAGIGEDGGGRRARAPSDWCEWELLCWRRLVEENGGDAVELMVAMAWRGEAGNGGDGDLAGG
jgi:hypothetical protein